MQINIVRIILFIFIFQNVAPAYAVITSVNDPHIDELETTYGKGVPLPASPYFKSEPGVTAAGVMVVAQHQSEWYALLGKRDDEDTWCNFGGKSEADHKDLCDTAAIELQEESVGMYVTHRNRLRASPSHTLLTDDGPAYRMYITEFGYRPSTELEQLMAETTDAHSQEYRAFKWFKLSTLVDVVTKSGEESDIRLTTNDALMDEGGAIQDGEKKEEEERKIAADFDEDVVLFQPLARMLKESVVLGHLKKLLAGEKLGMINTLRRWVAGPQVTERDKDKTEYLKDESGKVTPFTPRDIIDQGYTVQWDKEGERQMVSLKSQQDAAIVVEKELDISAEEKQFLKGAQHEILAQHLISKALDMDMLLLPAQERMLRYLNAFDAVETTVSSLSPSKEKINSETIWGADDVPAESDDFNPAALGSDCPTLRHLKLTMGPDYKPDDLKGTLKVYLHHLKETMLEFKHREFNYTEAQLDTLIHLIDQEQKEWEKGRMVFYHGAEGDIGAMSMAFSVMQSLLKVQPYEVGDREGLPITAVRGNDLYYSKLMESIEGKSGRPVKQIQEYFKGAGDYYEPLRLARICANFALTAGPYISQSTSNTLEYWLAAHSVGTFDKGKIFNQSTTLLGVPIGFSTINSVFRQAYGIQGNDNGVLLQMFTDPRAVKNLIHAHHARLGKNPVLEAPEEGDNTDIISHYKELYHPALGAKERGEDTTETAIEPGAGAGAGAGEAEKDLEAKEAGDKKLVDTQVAPEVWMYPLPGMFATLFETRVYRKNEATSDQLTTLKNNLMSEISYSLAEWLAGHHQVIPGAFHDMEEGKITPAVPLLQKIYIDVFTKVFGEKPGLSPPTSILPLIINSGNPNVMATLTAASPEMESHIQKNAEGYIKLAATTWQLEMAEYLLNTYRPGAALYKKDAESIFTEEEVFQFVEVKLIKEYARVLAALEYIGLDDFDTEKRQGWARSLIDEADDNINILYNTINLFQKDAAGVFISSLWNWDYFEEGNLPEIRPTLSAEARESFDINHILRTLSPEEDRLIADILYKGNKPHFEWLLMDLGAEGTIEIDGIPLCVHMLTATEEAIRNRAIEHYRETFKSLPNLPTLIFKRRYATPKDSYLGGDKLQEFAKGVGGFTILNRSNAYYFHPEVLHLVGDLWDLHGELGVIDQRISSFEKVPEEGLIPEDLIAWQRLVSKQQEAINKARTHIRKLMQDGRFDPDGVPTDLIFKGKNSLYDEVKEFEQNQENLKNDLISKLEEGSFGEDQIEKLKQAAPSTQLKVFYEAFFGNRDFGEESLQAIVTAVKPILLHAAGVKLPFLDFADSIHSLLKKGGPKAEKLSSCLGLDLFESFILVGNDVDHYPSEVLSDMLKVAWPNGSERLKGKVRDEVIHHFTSDADIVLLPQILDHEAFMTSVRKKIGGIENPPSSVMVFGLLVLRDKIPEAQEVLKRYPSMASYSYAGKDLVELGEMMFSMNELIGKTFAKVLVDAGHSQYRKYLTQ